MICDPNAAFFGFMGITLATVFSNAGAAYGTAKTGTAIASLGVMRPDMVMRSIIPVVMAGILGIYGLILAVVIAQQMMKRETYSTFAGYAHFSAGACLGFSALAAGLAIGIVGDCGVRCNAVQPRLFVGMMLILIFGEALALYGVILAIIVAASSGGTLCTSWMSTV
ncbi:MAG: hypothetical protein KVP17_002568 [Porospora cf. gigantea B]|uniref:uncharacterized protein n=2 Tax=Porospora cf. gigantea A TaxID=2853593 RepID=UPI003559ACC1|nr:MAG: hypothetical protein KVP18_004658 [Porospora cf. gigantea A]KAH0474764.1 MAG: hypothetical protein KVP17_002568 [Porospora cf. gigantea B]